MAYLDHHCGTCYVPSAQHNEACGEGCHHWPALCCPGCPCESFEAAHRAARTSDQAPLVHFKPYGSYQSSCGISPLKEGPDTTDERARTTCQDCRACFRNPSDAERLGLVKRQTFPIQGHHNAGPLSSSHNTLETNKDSL